MGMGDFHICFCHCNSRASVKSQQALCDRWTVTHEAGFDTDLSKLRHAFRTVFSTLHVTDLGKEPAWNSIDLQQVRFTGGVSVTENGTLYRLIDPRLSQYVGEPSSEIDEAWDDLVYAPEVGLYGKDAESLVGMTYQCQKVAVSLRIPSVTSYLQQHTVHKMCHLSQNIQAHAKGYDAVESTDPEVDPPRP
jgi:hypothetical protein